MPNADLSNHIAWLESKRRSRARRAAARKQRGRERRRRTGAIVAAAATLTFAAGGAFAHDRATSASAVRSAGSSVAALQAALGIAADGVYGPNTRRAVRRYQRNHGLAADGIAGPVTLASLGLAGGAGAPARSSGGGSGSAPSAALARIAQCESSGNPRAVSASGRYRGKYQFSRQTWRAYGGVGDPAAASEAEQDRIAAKLYAARGSSPWPACGG